MTRSPPANRRSQHLKSPPRGFLTSLLDDDRNAELTLSEALAAAQLEHDRVRETALRVFEQHELEERQRRIREEEKKEQERLKREAEIAAEELRLRELRAKSIPKPPPEPEPKPEPVPPKKPDPPKEEHPKAPESVKKEEPVSKPTPAAETPKPSPFATQSASKPNPFAAAAKPVQTQAANPFAETANGSIQPSQKEASPAPAPQPAAAAPAKPTKTSPSVASKDVGRYNLIHQELKQLRKNLTAESKKPGNPLKGQLGNFRREIRVSIGQLTSEKGANKVPVEKIMTTLRKARSGEIASPPVPVKTYVGEDRQPVDGAVNNDDTLPSLFIYLLNIVAKGIINQFINEGGANPKSADPVGVVAVQIFSLSDFLWRGKTLIDILIAKFFKVCPVLFGLRGNDKTEQGRKALGWRKEGPTWITEQSHNDRMTGLGAGFAAISLRDFSRTSKTNPYPPTHYWMALAAIVNTPLGETSNTQYVVLRSIIEGHHQRFLNFYGNAALAALKLALVEFPKRAPKNAPAASSLGGLTEMLKLEGLVLA